MARFPHDPDYAGMVKLLQDLLFSRKRLHEDAVIRQLWMRDFNSGNPGGTHVGRSKDIGHSTTRGKIVDAVVVEQLAAQSNVIVSGR